MIGNGRIHPTVETVGILPQPSVKERPSKEQLAQEIDSMSFIALGKKYGVSDNAVRKWAKAYGLLFRSRDVKKAREALGQNSFQRPIRIMA